MDTATKVHVLDCGAMSCDLGWLLLKQDRTLRSRHNRDKPVEWYSCASHAVLVETSAGRLIWDTSCPRDWETRWADAGFNDYLPYDQVTEEQYLDSRLTQLGVAPSAIDFAVLSHLHCDHAGNAKLFADAGVTMVCSKAEYEFAFGYDGPFRDGHLKADYEGVDFQTVEGDAEFLPGVTLIQAPGHTPGQMAMQVELPETGTMIFTSDAVYMGDSYGPPAVKGTFIHDLPSWYQSVEKIRDIAIRTNATVIFGHDSEQIRTLKLAPHEYYT